MRRQADQVIAIGAIAMEQHHQMRWRRLLRAARADLRSNAMAGKMLGCAMIVTRFAPSPTGYLHLGHAFAALTAARAGERFLLRIEDLDTERAREEFVTAIFEDLAWLGLTWEEPVLRQSKRFDAYRRGAGASCAAFTYPCFCTRKEIAEEIARAVEAPHADGTGRSAVSRHLPPSFARRT